jgi:hypothetical protein
MMRSAGGGPQGAVSFSTDTLLPLLCQDAMEWWEVELCMEWWQSLVYGVPMGVGASIDVADHD